MLEGEAGLLAAVLARAVDDARHPRPASRPTSATPTFGQHLSAIEWLVSAEVLVEYADALNLNGEWLRAELLREAGISHGTPRLGQRRRPRPAIKAASDAPTTTREPNGRCETVGHVATKERPRRTT